MKIFFKIGLPWAFSLGLVFYLGLQLGSSIQKEKNEIPTVSVFPASKEPDPIKEEETEEKILTANSILSATNHSPSIPTPPMPPNLQRIMQGGDIVERLGSYLDAVRSMDKSNVKQVIRAFEELPSGYGRHLEMKLLMRSWANFDPEGALAYASSTLDSKSERRFGISEALAGWAIKDTAAAIEWANRNHPGRQNGDNPLLVGVIKGLAETSLSEADQLMLGLPDGSARWQASTFLAQEYSKGDIQQAMEWADRYPDSDPRMRETIVGQIGANLAKRDLQATAHWVTGMKKEPATERVMENLINQWVGESPEDAAQWIDGLDVGYNKGHAMRALSNRWSIKDPIATAEWLNQLPISEHSDGAINEFVSRIRLQDPEGAAGWAATISDPTIRENALQRVVESWKESDPEGLKSWQNAQGTAPANP
jgi:hypothetical protein